MGYSAVEERMDWLDFVEECEAVHEDLEKVEARPEYDATPFLEEVDELQRHAEESQTVTARMRKRLHILGQRAQRWLDA